MVGRFLCTKCCYCELLGFHCVRMDLWVACAMAMCCCCVVIVRCLEYESRKGMNKRKKNVIPMTPRKESIHPKYRYIWSPSQERNRLIPYLWCTYLIYVLSVMPLMRRIQQGTNTRSNIILHLKWTHSIRGSPRANNIDITSIRSVMLVIANALQ